MQTFGLIGFPLIHSFSAAYFKKKFQDEHIEAQYVNFEIDNIQKINEITKNQPNLKGFNVTIPYKQQIIPFLNNISQEAQEIGAVNCVKINDGYLIGYNTDAYGFEKSLTSFIPTNISNALILGNGGAAKAIQYVLKKLHIHALTVSRHPGSDNEIGYHEIDKYINNFFLIVNTTPLGTFPNTQTYPNIPYEKLTVNHYLFDLVYNPKITEFLRRGQANNAHIHNGYEMLIGQAEKGWEIWNQNIK